MNKRILASALGLGAAVALSLSGCTASEAGESGADGESKGSITLAVFNFDELIAISNLWAAILEDEGYDVTLQTADKAPAFLGLASGDYDAILSVWSAADARYIEQYGDDIVDLGTWNDEASLTIAVNADAPIDSLAELADNAAEFDNKLVGIEAGASLTAITQDVVIPTYGLEDLDYVISSTPAMLTELQAAIESGENIAVTLWRPHWAYNAYELKDLEDPEGTLGEADTMNVFSSKELEEKSPEVFEWLTAFEMDSDRLHSLENLLFNENSTQDYEPLVREWIADNQDWVDSLTP